VGAPGVTVGVAVGAPSMTVGMEVASAGWAVGVPSITVGEAVGAPSVTVGAAVVCSGLSLNDTAGDWDEGLSLIPVGDAVDVGFADIDGLTDGLADVDGLSDTVGTWDAGDVDVSDSVGEAVGAPQDAGGVEVSSQRKVSMNSW